MESIKNFWFNLSDKIRFFIVGGFNAGVQCAIFALLITIFGGDFCQRQISLALSWFLSSFVSFTTQKYLVFNVEGNIVKQYLKCCTTWLFSYIINVCLLEVFVKIIKTNIILNICNHNLSFDVCTSQILATGVAAIFTYIAFKLFAFRGPHDN